MNELLQTITQIGERFTEFTKLNGTKLDGLSRQNAELLERVEQIETRGSLAGLGGGGTGDRRELEHKRVFENWLRKPQGQTERTELENCQKDLLSRKAVTIGTPADGGYAVPDLIGSQIERVEIKLSPVRRLIKIVQTSSSDYKELVDLGGTGGGWVGESGSRTETNTPTIREATPTFGELYAYPKASEWSLDDIFFNVSDWLAENVGRTFSQKEGVAVLTGSGSNQPTGMLHTTPVTTADHASPLRAAAAYQYVACPSVSSPAVAEITGDALITLLYTLNSIYRSQSTWVMNSTTAGAVRKLKDAMGNYLWLPGMVAGQPDLLLGRPVEIWEDMDDVGNNKFPVAIGDFSRGYLLADRVGLRITVDNVTTAGFVKFYVRRREGGIVLNNDAVKWLKTTTS